MSQSKLNINTHVGMALNPTTAVIADRLDLSTGWESAVNSSQKVSPPISSSVYPKLGISGSFPYQPVEGGLTRIFSHPNYIVLDILTYNHITPNGSTIDDTNIFPPYSYVILEGMITHTTPTTVLANVENEMSTFTTEYSTNFNPTVEASTGEYYSSTFACSTDITSGYSSIDQFSKLYYFPTSFADPSTNKQGDYRITLYFPSSTYSGINRTLNLKYTFL